MTGMFVGWFDDDPKKPAKVKLLKGLERYREKFGESASLVLVNAKDACTVQDVEVRVVEYVRPNNFWVGRREHMTVGATVQIASTDPENHREPLALLAPIHSTASTPGTASQRLTAARGSGWTRRRAGRRWRGLGSGLGAG